MRLLTKRLKQLDYVGEEGVFRAYLELGSTKKLTRKLFKPKGKAKSGDYGRMELYKWLHAEPERWELWQEVVRLRGHLEADEALEVAQAATPANASAHRAKMDAHKWRAERLNREDYGPPQQQVNVGVQVGSAWLEALQKIEATEAKIVQEPEPGPEKRLTPPPPPPSKVLST